MPTADAAPALAVHHLVKEHRRGLRANDDISLSVAPGTVAALLGPNGAGKTTLVRQVLGLSRPTAGQILIDGRDVVRDPSVARASCSFQPQANLSLAGFTPWQAVTLAGRLRGGERRHVEAAARGLLERLSIEAWARTPCARLSGGTLRLVTFAMAAVVPGRLVLLDEPTNDVDPGRRRALWGEIRALADAEHTVFLVTHNVLEAEQVVDLVGVLDGGRMAAWGTVDDLVDGMSRAEVRLARGGAEATVPELRETALERRGDELVVRFRDDRLPEVVEWASALRRSGSALSFAVGRERLEDAYLRLVGPVEEEG